MNYRQINIINSKINPSLKLAMIVMIQWPEASRVELASKMNIDDTQLSRLSSTLVKHGLITITKEDYTNRNKYHVKS